MGINNLFQFWETHYIHYNMVCPPTFRTYPSSEAPIPDKSAQGMLQDHPDCQEVWYSTHAQLYTYEWVKLICL